jgi:hypothetical protein
VHGTLKLLDLQEIEEAEPSKKSLFGFVLKSSAKVH